MTERIDHVAAATEMLGCSAITQDAEVVAHALLALVEQQRIANVLAAAHWVSNEHLGTKLDDLRMGVAGEVWDGLGLA